MTRIELRSPLLLPRVLLAAWSVNRSLRRAPSIVQASVLIESLTCVVITSMWTNPRGLEAVAKSRPHVDAARQTFRAWSRAVSSTQWHLTRVSASSRGLPPALDEALRELGGTSQRPGMLTVCGGAPVSASEERLAHG